MRDLHKHKGMRQKLVNELARKGITNKKVINAIYNVPRHFFLDDAFDEWAYRDVAFPIEAEQTISQPYTVAYQTQLLDVQHGDLVLEVGTGSGYQACILSEMGAKVYTIERQKSLYDKTSNLLNRMGYGNIRTLHGDGYLGAERFAPFDKIIVTAGATSIPNMLFEQLSINGKMVIPVGKNGSQTMLEIIKTDVDKFDLKRRGGFKFVPFLEGVS